MNPRTQLFNDVPMSIIKLANQLILNSKDYEQFNQKLKTKTTKEKGDIQEIFAKYFFLAFRKRFSVKHYYSRLLGDDIPERITVNENDVGTDAIIEHENGKVSLVQVKFRSNEYKKLRRECLGGMALEGLALKNNLECLYLFTNTIDKITNISKNESAFIKYILAEHLYSCDWGMIKRVVRDPKDKLVKQLPPLRDWQREATEFVFGDGIDFHRKQVIAACGAGKTVFSDQITREYSRVLVLVPNLHLLSQWFECYASWRPEYNYILVGSDLDDNETTVPYHLTTSTEEISERLGEEFFCICTYQSLVRLLDVPDINFELTVCDEAHHCCGHTASNFTLPAKKDFPSDNILFLTATPKIYRGGRNDFIDMDDEEIFGERFTYSFKQAIDDGHISDYEVIIGAGVGENFDRNEFEAEFIIASLIDYDIRSLLVCSTTHAKSKELCNAVKELAKDLDQMKKYKIVLMPSNASSKLKVKVINMMNRGEPIIVFNVRVFNIGSDIPPLQSVMLVGNRNSVIDTVQTISRCLRKHPDKDVGRILVPCLVEDGELDGEGDYKNVRSFISALGTIDSEIVEEVVARIRGEGGRGKIRVDMIFGDFEDLFGEGRVEFELRLFDRFGESVAFSWYKNLSKLEEFIEEYGRLPSERSKNPEEKFLYRWRTYQTTNYKNNKYGMSEPQRRKLWEEHTERYPELYITDDEKWSTNLAKLEEFIEENGRLPTKESKDPDEKTLGGWRYTQTSNYKSNKDGMSDPERRKVWEEHKEKYPELYITAEERWYDNLEKLEEFIEENERLPNTMSKDPEEKFIGNWRYTQTGNYKSNKGGMSDPNQRKLWEEHTEKYLELYMTVQERWYNNLEKLEKFIEENVRLPSHGSNDSEEKILADWQSSQTTNYKTTKYCMSDPEQRKLWEEHKEKYSELYMTAEERWYKNLEKLNEFIEENERPPFATSKDPEEKCLGKWRSHQIQNYKNNKGGMKDPEQRRLWEDHTEKYSELYMTAEERWHINLEKLEDFLNEHGNLPKERSKDPEEKILGKWQSQQTQNYKKNNKGMSDPERRKLWEEHKEKYPELYMTAEDRWYLNLKKLEEFIEENERLPSHGSKDPEERCIEQWRSHQTINYKNNKEGMSDPERRKLWEEHTARYSKLYMTDDEKWDNNLGRLEEFIDEYERLPSYDSKDPEEKKIRNWMSTQKQDYKNNKGRMKDPERRKLWEEHKEKYPELYMTIKERWYLNLRKLKEFIEENERLPSEYSKDPEEKFLGKWRSHQTTNYKNNKGGMKDPVKRKAFANLLLNYPEHFSDTSFIDDCDRLTKRKSKN